MASLRLPGARDVRGTLDESAGDSAVVVACPPHPQLAGDRHDARLQAVADALVEAQIDCLRFDYGAWDDGKGEQTDARMAIEWAAESYASVGLFGYSFGASIALLVAADDRTAGIGAVSALAPGESPAESAAVSGALDSIAAPVQIVYGERDDVVDYQPAVERARELNLQVESLPADHFFVGQHSKVADRIVAFLATRL